MDRVAIVTGGARGIGAEVCRVLARRGCALRSQISMPGAQDVAHELGNRIAATQPMSRRRARSKSFSPMRRTTSVRSGC